MSAEFAHRKKPEISLENNQFAKAMVDSVKEMLSESITKAFRLVIRFSDGALTPTLEMEPVEYWNYLRKLQNVESPTHDFKETDVMENYVAALETLVPLAERYVVMEGCRMEDETQSFHNQEVTLDPLWRGLTINFIEMLRGKSQKCGIEIKGPGRHTFKCPFTRKSSLSVGGKLGCSSLKFEVLIPEIKIPGFLLIPHLNSLSVPHTNEEMSVDESFWNFVKDVSNRIFQLTGQYPVILTMNFGNWESEVEKSRVFECHGHAHLLVSCAAADALKLHNGSMHIIPDLYRQKNIAVLKTEKLNFGRSILAPIMQQRIFEARFNSQANELHEMEKQMNSQANELHDMKMQMNSQANWLHDMKMQMNHVNEQVKKLDSVMTILEKIIGKM